MGRIIVTFQHATDVPKIHAHAFRPVSQFEWNRIINRAAKGKRDRKPGAPRPLPDPLAKRASDP